MRANSVWEVFLNTYAYKDEIHCICKILARDGTPKVSEFERLSKKHSELTGYIVADGSTLSGMCFKWESDETMFCTSAVEDVKVEDKLVTITTHSIIYVLERRGGA